MAEPLPDKIENEVARLYSEAEAFLDAEDGEQAQVQFQTAWELIPEPKERWQRALQVLGGIIDCQFFLYDFDAYSRTLQMALRMDGGGPANPWICLRLGQCYLQMGQEREAGNWLVSALMLGGTEMFEDEDQEYRDFLVERLAPPPGGWPKDWESGTPTKADD